jgi:hypothetical protein
MHMKYQPDEMSTYPLKVRQAIADENMAPQADQGSLKAAHFEHLQDVVLDRKS